MTTERMIGMGGNPTLSELTLNNIDFDWVKKTEKPKYLKKALKLLEDDGGYFIDLIKAVKERLKEIDPEYKQLEEARQEVDEETKKKHVDDINKFIDETDEMNDLGKKELEELKKRRKLIKQGEEAKIMGNNSMQAKEYKEAIKFYKEAVGFDPSHHIAYSNMAQAYIYMKQYKEAIESCNKSLEVESKFLKSYFRRAKAQMQLGNKFMAAKDCKIILSLDPKVKEAKNMLDKLKKSLSETEKMQLNHVSYDSNLRELGNTEEFKRLTVIEEDDDSDDSSYRPPEGEEEEQSDDESGEEEQDNQDQDPVEDDQEEDNKEDGEEAQEGGDDDTEEEKEAEANDDEDDKKSQESEEIQVDYPEPDENDLEAKEVNDEILKRVKNLNHIKTQITANIKKGQYQESIVMAQEILPTIKHLETQYRQMFRNTKLLVLKLKLSILSNLSYYHEKDEDPKGVISWSIKAEEVYKKMLEINPMYSINSLVRNINRRANAYEKLEKYALAKKEFQRLKEIEPHLDRGFKGYNRCQQRLNEITKTVKSTETGFRVRVNKTSNFNSDEVGKDFTTSPYTGYSSSDYMTSNYSNYYKNWKETIKENSVTWSVKNDIEKLVKLKVLGNDHFRKNDMSKAYDIFTRGISKIEENHETIKYGGQGFAKDLVKVYVQLLLNRGAASIRLKKYSQGIKDAEKIFNVDFRNFKAYFRRGMCYHHMADDVKEKAKGIKNQELLKDLILKRRGYLNECIGDFKILMKSKIEDKTAIKKNLEINQKKLEEVENLIKDMDFEVEEVVEKSENKEEEAEVEVVKDEVEEKGTEEENVEEVKEEKAPEVKEEKVVEKEEEKVVEEKKEEIVTISENIVDKALMDIINNSSLPSSASQFELELKSFKDKYTLMWKYLDKFNPSILTKIYKVREMEADYCEILLNCFKTNLNSETATKIANYLISIKTTSDADLMIKFLSKSMKAELSQLVENLSNNFDLDPDLNYNLQNGYPS